MPPFITGHASLEKPWIGICILWKPSVSWICISPLSIHLKLFEEGFDFFYVYWRFFFFFFLREYFLLIVFLNFLQCHFIWTGSAFIWTVQAYESFLIPVGCFQVQWDQGLFIHKKWTCNIPCASDSGVKTQPQNVTLFVVLFDLGG